MSILKKFLGCGPHTGAREVQGIGSGPQQFSRGGTRSQEKHFASSLITLLQLAPRQLYAEFACLLSAAAGMLLASWRSLAQPRWALYWLCVLSLILLCLWYFMPPQSVIDFSSGNPMRFLRWKFNLLLLVAALVVVASNTKETR